MRDKYNEYAQKESEAINEGRNQSSHSSPSQPSSVRVPATDLLNYMKRHGAIKQQRVN